MRPAHERPEPREPPAGHPTAPAPASDAPAYAPGSVAEALARFVAAVANDTPAGTLQMHRVKGGHAARLLGGLRLADLRIDHVDGYIAARLAEGAARGTVYKELCTLRLALRWAHDRGHLRTDPRGLFPRFRARYVPRDRYLSPDEMARLVTHVQPERRAWLLVALYTGARFSEVCALDWEKHVNLAEGWLTVPGTKTARARRRMPICGPLRQVLESLPEPHVGLVVGPWANVRRGLEVACRDARVARVTPNDLRRTFTSWMKQAGVDSLAVAQLLGHSSTRMVELVYGRLDGPTLQRAVAALPPLPPDALDATGPVPRSA